MKKSKVQQKAEVKKETKVGVVKTYKVDVDQYVPNSSNYEVMQAKGVIYSTTLNQSNIGRVGVQGSNVLKPANGIDDAIKQYLKKNRDKEKGGYTVIEINYDEDNGDEDDNKGNKKVDTNKKRPESKLAPEVQKVIKLIFDKDMILKNLKKIGYDDKKMPLGKLGDSTINQAFKVLGDISKEIAKSNCSQDTLNNLSGKFYSLIPHDFGYQKMSNFVLHSDNQIKDKMEMLQSLIDMKKSTEILDQSNKTEENPDDYNYKLLHNKITHVDPNSSEYKMIIEYINDALKSNGGYGSNSRKIKYIYKLDRQGDEPRFDTKIGNNQLLWHGSRLQNFGGILSSGLRIAPPEAPVNGYMYGKGLYFANSFNTSDAYSNSYDTNESLILLCKVALGKVGPLKSCHAPCIDPQYQSCIGYSCVTLPDKVYEIHNGLKVPLKGSASLAHNAYIVYNVNQAVLKYLIWYER